MWTQHEMGALPPSCPGLWGVGVHGASEVKGP